MSSKDQSKQLENKAGTNPRKSFFYRLCRHKTALFSLCTVLIFLLTALTVEIYAICAEYCDFTPAYELTSPETFAPPSTEHIMGTDYMGRDCLLRAIGGIATAVKVGVIAALIAAAIGVTLGMLAGFYGGRLDSFVIWLYSTFAAMPTLLFILAFALLFTRGYLAPELMAPVNFCAQALHTEPGMLAVYLAIGLTGWVTLCKVTRAETMKLRNQTFVQAARVCGVSNVVIIFRHILPNLMHLVIIYFTLRFAYAVMTEVLVSYLGLGVKSAPSWGIMISDGQERLWCGVWWEVTAATVFMFILVLALNLLGDSLRDLLDPKSENRK
ncbi:MAG: ABC transporter permease [Lentisphaerae bacterium]|nr:ABC transporter permease [Lentisphaerota bacterium]